MKFSQNITGPKNHWLNITCFVATLVLIRKKKRTEQKKKKEDGQLIFIYGIFTSYKDFSTNGLNSCLKFMQSL